MVTGKVTICKGLGMQQSDLYESGIDKCGTNMWSE